MHPLLVALANAEPVFFLENVDLADHAGIHRPENGKGILNFSFKPVKVCTFMMISFPEYPPRRTGDVVLVYIATPSALATPAP